MRLIDSTYFTKNNEVNLPLADELPTSYVGSNNTQDSDAIDNLCERVEEEILINALGLEVYEEIANANTITVLPEHLQWLINGKKYDGKWFKGLADDLSCIVYAIYFQYINQTTQVPSALGVIQNNPENATQTIPNYFISNANQMFLKLYQGVRCDVEVSVGTYRGVTYRDYYNASNYIVSLREFINDHKEYFDNTKFIEYKNSYNSFGL